MLVSKLVLLPKFATRFCSFSTSLSPSLIVSLLGRQVDGAIGSLEALPGIVEAVGQDLEILFDSGIRSASDAFKALALGAKAIMIGRLWVYGLSIAGEMGVRHVLRSFLAEFDILVSL